MNVREFLNNNPAVATIGAVVLLIVCLALIVRQLLGTGGPGTIGDVFFYDNASNQVYLDSPLNLPPAEAPSGAGNGFRAYIFACGDCAEIASEIDAGMTPDQIAQLGAHLVYVERYKPEDLQRLQAATDGDAPGNEYEVMPEVALVVNGAPQKWMPQYDMTNNTPADEQWDTIRDKHMSELCPDRNYGHCMPPR